MNKYLSTTIIKILGSASSYFLIILINNRMGIDYMGYYSLIISSILLLSSFCSLGTNVSIIKFINQQKNELYIYKGTRTVVFITSIILGFLIYIFKNNIKNLIFKNLEYGNELVLIFSICVPIFVITLLNQEFFKAKKMINLSELIRILFKNAILIILIFLVSYFNSLSILNFIFILFLSIILNYILSEYISVKLLKNKNIFFREISKKDIQNIKTSLFMWFTNLSNILRRNLPIFFLGTFMTIEDVGLYTTIFKYTQIVTIFGISSVAIVGAKSAEFSDKENLQNILDQSSKFLFKYATLALIILFFFSFIYLELTLTKNYNDIIIIILVFLFMEYINTIFGNVSIVMNMVGYHKVFSYLNIFIAILTFFSCFFIIKEYGIVGALGISSVSTLLINLIGFIILKNKHKVSTIIFIK